MNDFINLRKKLGYGRHKVAKMSGLSYGTIFNIEHDLHDVGHKKIAQLQHFYEAELAKVQKNETDN